MCVNVEGTDLSVLGQCVCVCVNVEGTDLSVLGQCVCVCQC